MLVKTQGIVLRTVKYGETSLILDIYTHERGRQSYIIGGVRSQKARTRQSVVAVSSLVELVAYHKERQTLHRIKEVKPAYVYQSIPFNVVKGTVALFMTELLNKAVKEEEQNEILFDFIVNSYIALDEAKKATLFPLVFAVLLLPNIGFQPGNEWSEETPYFDIRESIFVEVEPHAHYFSPENSLLFYMLLKADIANLVDIQLTKQERHELLEGVLRYYEYHIDGFKKLNSYDILVTVFS